LNMELTRSELSDHEIIRAKELVQEKYTHPSWLERI